MNDFLLMVPGPTNLSEKVRDEMSKPQLGHMTPEFYEKFAEIVRLARYAFKNNSGSQIVFTGSGMYAMEASIVSAIQRGDKVLVLNTGYFGDRMIKLSAVHGAKVSQLQYPIGSYADPDDLRKKLRKNRYRAVFITHVDTSTTVVNPIRSLVTECKNAGVFAVVDSVCGLGAEELDCDKLGADIVFTASQKALAAPPGAALIAVSSEMMDYFGNRREPIESFNFNLLEWKATMDDPRIYRATPAVQVMMALRQALFEIKNEGIEERWKRHKVLADVIRSGLTELGVAFVAEEGHRANTVTGFFVEQGRAPEIQRVLREEHRIEVARGLGDHGGDMIRIGHFGILNAQMTERVVKAVLETFRKLDLSKRGQSAMATSRTRTNPQELTPWAGRKVKRRDS